MKSFAISAFVMAFTVRSLFAGYGDGAYLHLDASSGAFELTASADGAVDSVERWYDISGSGHDAWAGNTGYDLAKAKPTLRASELAGGKTVVDLGGYSMRDSGTYAASDSAWMQFAGLNVKEGYIVMRFKSPASDSFYFGDTGDNYAFHRGDNGEYTRSDEWTAYWNGNEIFWRVDGVQCDSATTAPDGEFHLLSFRLNNAKYVSTFSFDRDIGNANAIRCGGLEIGEVILFADAQTDARRDEIEAALLAKWIDAPTAAGDTLAVRKLNNEGRYVKSGANSMAVDSAPALETLAVESGDFALDDSIAGAEFVHFDMSDLSTMTYSVEGGVTNVTRIESRNGNGRFAYENTSLSKASPKLVAVPGSPYPLLDFGAFYVNGNGDLSQCDTADSASMLFSEGVRAHTFFFVAMPNSDNDQHWLSYCFADQGNAPFDRSNKNLIDPTWSQDAMKYAEWTVNGEAVAIPTEFSTPAGINVYSVRVSDAYSQPPSVNALAQSSLYRLGGMRYGEVVIFERRLSDEEMAEVGNALLKKWKNIDPPTISSVLAKAAFHIDPSDGDTLVEENGEVVRINDVRGNGKYAYKPSYIASGATLVPSGAGGLDTLDLGECYVWTGDVNKLAGEGNGGFALSERMDGTMRTAFVVVEKKGLRDPFVLGDVDAYQFHADSGKLLNGENNPDQVKYAAWRRDGVSVVPYETDFSADGLHVLEIEIPVNYGGATVGTLGIDRYALLDQNTGTRGAIRAGGLRYGEVILYTGNLSGYERSLVSGYLLEKWIAKEAAPETREFSGIALAAGSAFDFGGNLSIAEGGTLACAVNGAHCGTVSVEGVFVAHENVTVEISGRIGAGAYDLVSAGGISGAANVETWTLDIDDDSTAALEVSSSAIRLVLRPVGMVIFMR